MKFEEERENTRGKGTKIGDQGKITKQKVVTEEAGAKKVKRIRRERDWPNSDQKVEEIKEKERTRDPRGSGREWQKDIFQSKFFQLFFKIRTNNWKFQVRPHIIEEKCPSAETVSHLASGPILLSLINFHSMWYTWDVSISSPQKRSKPLWSVGLNMKPGKWWKLSRTKPNTLSQTCLRPFSNLFAITWLWFHLKPEHIFYCLFSNFEFSCEHTLKMRIHFLSNHSVFFVREIWERWGPSWVWHCGEGCLDICRIAGDCWVWCVENGDSFCFHWQCLPTPLCA